MMDHRLTGWPDGFLGLGRMIQVLFPIYSIRCRWNIELMIEANDGDIWLAYFSSSLLISFHLATGECLFCKVFTAFHTSLLTGSYRDLGSPIKGFISSLSGSVNCFLNQSLMLSAFLLWWSTFMIMNSFSLNTYPILLSQRLSPSSQT